MELIENTLVVGACAPFDLLKLSVLDLLTGHINWACIYYFEKTPDLTLLKAALTRTLDIFPAIGGALVSQNEAGGVANSLYIHRNNTGVRFCVYRSDESYNEACPPGTLLDGSPLLGSDISVKASLNTGAPLTSVQIIQFADGDCVLALRNAHTFDGPTIRNFMLCWSVLYRGVAPAPANKLPREHIDRLALGNGYRPSDKFAIAPPLNFSLGHEISAHKNQFGKIAVEVAAPLIDEVVAHCKRQSELPLTSSDVIHALVWQAFALCASAPGSQLGKIYSIFNLRRVRGLDIPDSYDGNAVIERHAKLPFSDLRGSDIQRIAELFHLQLKPLTAHEVRQDIAFLLRERSRGHIDDDGRFTNFVRSSLIDCIDGSGVYVNNLSMMEPAEVHFNCAARSFELMGNLGLATLFIYRHDDGTWVFHHVGRKTTLPQFADTLARLVSRKREPDYQFFGHRARLQLPDVATDKFAIPQEAATAAITRCYDLVL